MEKGFNKNPCANNNQKCLFSDLSTRKTGKKKVAGIGFEPMTSGL